MESPVTTINYADYSPCDYADALPRSQFMDPGIQPLWQIVPRIAGPAFTVRCGRNDHLMLHVAIYEANPGDILVVEGEGNYALAGGNVCAIAQNRGIAGMVIDGYIRDLQEVREMQFPVFARGVIPKPGTKKYAYPLQQQIIAGGVKVFPGDIVIADEEGIAVAPAKTAADDYLVAKKRAESDASQTLEQWQASHNAKVMATYQKILASIE